MHYSTSKFRVLLLSIAMAAAIYGLTDSKLYGQTPATPAAPAAGEAPKKTIPDSLAGVIFSNTDFVFWTIVACSIAGMTFIFQGFIRSRESVYMPAATINTMREMIAARQFKELIEYTETEPSFVSQSLNPALKRAPSFSAMKEAMETSVGEQTADAFRKIEWLNIIGNLGPLLGLLGTVLGMMVAFTDMAKAGAGGANPSDLAGGISKALAHTFLGLALAVPCLAAFGVLRTLTDRLTVKSALIAEELLLLIKPAEAKTAATASVQPKQAVPQPAITTRKAPTVAPNG